jgi:hypothetical protein
VPLSWSAGVGQGDAFPHQLWGGAEGPCGSWRAGGNAVPPPIAAPGAHPLVASIHIRQPAQCAGQFPPLTYMTVTTMYATWWLAWGMVAGHQERCGGGGVSSAEVQLYRAFRLFRSCNVFRTDCFCQAYQRMVIFPPLAISSLLLAPGI